MNHVLLHVSVSCVFVDNVPHPKNPSCCMWLVVQIKTNWTETRYISPQICSHASQKWDKIALKYLNKTVKLLFDI